MNTPNQQYSSGMSTPEFIPVKLARDPNRAMQQMMETIDALRQVYEQETQALQALDTQAFLALQDAKQRSAHAYQSHVNEMIMRKEDMQKADPALKQQLERMRNDFAELSRLNMEALDRMQRTMDRLSMTIRSAAKDAAQKHSAYSYSETGMLQMNNKKCISLGDSETA